MNIKEERPFNYHKCSWCLFRTKSVGVILSHFKKHQQKSGTNGFLCETAKLEAFECQHCDFENGLKIALDRHIKLAHGEDQQPDPEIQLKGYICEKCDFETYSLLVFARHLCDASQVGAQIIKNKINLRNVEKEGTFVIRFKCTQCSFKARYKNSLKTHVILCHQDPNDVKWFQCEECSFKTKSYSNLKIHILRKHQDVNEVTSEQDYFKTIGNPNLKEHILWKWKQLFHHEEWFQCEQCPFKAKRKDHLKRHILWKHLDPEEVKWFQCEHCPFKTKENSALKKHISRKHLDPEEVKWFQCEQCPFKTKTKNNMKMHMIRKHLNV